MNVRSARQSFPGYVLALADGLRAGLEGVGAQVVSRPEPESRPSLTTFMDYEVFLVSRIREQYVHGDEPRPTIRHGIAAIGQVVIAAATIMAVVFLSFMLGDDRIIKEFGFGLGLAILIDAFLAGSSSCRRSCTFSTDGRGTSRVGSTGRFLASRSRLPPRGGDRREAQRPAAPPRRSRNREARALRPAAAVRGLRGARIVGVQPQLGL